MSDRTKEWILKTLLVIDSVLMIATFPGMFLIGCFISNEDMVEIVAYIIIFSAFAVGGLFMILLPIFGGLKQKPVKAEKILIPFCNYRELTEFLQKSLYERKYFGQKSLPLGVNGEIIVYTKKARRWVLDCVAIIRTSELSEEVLDIANSDITDILTKYYDGKISDTVNMISVFCVDRITPTFRKLVNSNIQQGFKNRRLPVGISFGGKAVYIAKQKDGFAIAQYKKLRKEFMAIMKISEDKN